MMIRTIAVAFFCVLCLTPTSLRAQERAADPFFDHAALLGVAYGLEMLTVRLSALGAFADPPAGLIENSERMVTRDLPRFAGSLQQADPALARQLEFALTDLLQRGRTREAGGLLSAMTQAKTLTAQAREVLLPSELRSDPAFAAALATRLLLADDGVAEAYEDVAGGEQWAYPNGWAALRRVREIWMEMRPAADEEVQAEIDEMLGLLAELFPSPGPPAEIRGDPEEAEAPAHRIVALLETAIGGSLFPDRDRAALIGLVRSTVDSACAAYAGGMVALGTERIASARFLYDEYLGGVVRLFAPEADSRATEQFEQLRARTEPDQSTAYCEALGETLSEIQSTVED